MIRFAEAQNWLQIKYVFDNFPIGEAEFRDEHSIPETEIAPFSKKKIIGPRGLQFLRFTVGSQNLYCTVWRAQNLLSL